MRYSYILYLILSLPHILISIAPYNIKYKAINEENNVSLSIGFTISIIDKIIMLDNEIVNKFDEYYELIDSIIIINDKRKIRKRIIENNKNTGEF